jgi:CRISPR/Cas system-associated endoribonuclease Cas2
MTGENTTNAEEMSPSLFETFENNEAIDLETVKDVSPVATDVNDPIAANLERLDQMDRDIAQIESIASEISAETAGIAATTIGNVIQNHGIQDVSQQVSLLEPRLSSIQSSIFEHQIELRTELHAMRAEFGKLQQQQDDQVSKLNILRDRLQEKMNSLGLSQTTQLGVTVIAGVLAVAVVGWVGSSIVDSIRRATSPIQPDSPEAFVYQHLQDIRDGKLESTWAQAADSFKEQAAQGNFDAYEKWWDEVAYPLPETAVTNVTQVKLYTEWSYCNRETKEVLQNVGFWYLSKVPGNEWRLDRIEIPPNLPARKVGKC